MSISLYCFISYTVLSLFESSLYIDSCMLPGSSVVPYLLVASQLTEFTPPILLY